MIPSRNGTVAHGFHMPEELNRLRGRVSQMDSYPLETFDKLFQWVGTSK